MTSKTSTKPKSGHFPAAMSEEAWAATTDAERIAHIRAGGFMTVSQTAEILQSVNEDIRKEAEYLESLAEFGATPLPSSSLDDALVSRLKSLTPEVYNLTSIKEYWRQVNETFSEDELKQLRMFRLKEIAETQVAIQRQLDELTGNQPDKPRLRRQNLAPLADKGHIKSSGDRLNKAAVESLMPGAMKPFSEIQADMDALEARGLTTSKKYWAAYPFNSKKGLHGAIGLTKNPGEVIWKMLQSNGALAVKAQYALWARAYKETDADPHKLIVLSVSQFCTDLGFKKKKGAHERSNKHKAIEVLELLTSLELSAIYQNPRGKVVHLHGPLWMRGGVTEELDGYTDLFGESHHGNPADRMAWNPTAFAYAPGVFFADPAWRKYNHNVALIGEGLLQLGTGNEDKWAVMVGGYLALLARMNGYRQMRVSVARVVERTGLLFEMKHRQPGRMREKLQRALDRLKLVKIIKDAHFTSEPEDIDLDDFNDTQTLDNLAEPHRWSDGWMHQSILVEWSEDLEQRGSALIERKQKRITHATTKKRCTKASAEAQILLDDE